MCASGGRGAHVQAEQLEDVLGDDAVALALQRAGLQEGINVIVPRQPRRLLLLAQQPQILCMGPHTGEPVAKYSRQVFMACIVPLWTLRRLSLDLSGAHEHRGGSMNHAAGQ